VNGGPARDVSSHFVQRWNHHRSSTSQYAEPILRDITDNLYFSCCARCKLENILETAAYCPNCHYDLGSTNSYSTPVMSFMLPPLPSEHSYVLFECSFGLTFPFRMEGECPAIVTSVVQIATTLTSDNILSKEIERQCNSSGLLESVGPKASELQEIVFSPSVGDVIYAIDGQVVTHMNARKIYRLLKMKVTASKESMLAKGSAKAVVVTFRRHYIPNESSSSSTTASSKLPPLVERPEDFSQLNDSSKENANSEDITQPADVNVEVVKEVNSTPVLVRTTPSIAQEQDSKTEQNPVKLKSSSAKATETYNAKCRSIANKEQLLSMSLLVHVHARNLDLVPRLTDETGTCHVQVLRSVGKWSIGIKTECSIMKCWVETIRSAVQFIYIENQFFIGNLAGEDVVNGVPLAIAERILQAHANKQVCISVSLSCPSLFLM